MIKPEIIVSLGADEGSITLYGVKLNQDWHFLLKYDKSSEIIDYVEKLKFDDHASFLRGFQSAIELLDVYRWQFMIPRSVHPEFAEELLAEVEKRIQPNHIRLTFWKRLVARSLNLKHIVN